MRFDGQRSTLRSGEETVGRHVIDDEGARPRKIAPWPWSEASFSPWNWSEARNQFEKKRLSKSQI